MCFCFLKIADTNLLERGLHLSIKQLKLYINQRRVFMLRLDAKYCDKISFLSSLFAGPFAEACPPLNSSNASFVRVTF
jgi:hypothetical protein